MKNEFDLCSSAISVNCITKKSDSLISFLLLSCKLNNVKVICQENERKNRLCMFLFYQYIKFWQIFRWLHNYSRAVFYLVEDIIKFDFNILYSSLPWLSLWMTGNFHKKTFSNSAVRLSQSLSTFPYFCLFWSPVKVSNHSKTKQSSSSSLFDRCSARLSCPEFFVNAIC